MTDSHRRLIQVSLLLAITAFGGWLRFRQASDSLWLDELHTAWVVTGDANELSPRARMGNQSPVYFRAVSAVSETLGKGELTMRLLSLIAGTSLPIAVWALTRRLLSEGTEVGSASSLAPLLAAWLVAVDSVAVFYSQEARPYACVQLLAVVHLWLLTMLLQEPRWWTRAIWLAFAWLLIQLHYTTALFVAAEVLFRFGYVLATRRETSPAELRRRQAASIAIDSLILLLLTTPAARDLQAIYSRRQNWALFVEQVGLQQIAQLPEMIRWSPAALYFLVAEGTSFAVARITGRRAQLRRDELASATTSPSSQPGEPTRATIWLLLACFVIPILIAAATSAFDWLRLWHLRYLIAVTPIAFVLAGMLPSLVRGRGAVLVTASIALAAGIVSHHSLDWTTARGISQRGEDWRSAVVYLNKQSRDTPVLLRSGLIESEALRTSDDEQLKQYCNFPLTSLYPVQQAPDDIHPLTMTRSGELPENLVRILAPAPSGKRKIWLVVRGAKKRADQTIAELQRSFAQLGIRADVVEHAPFGRVHAIRIDLSRR